MLDDRLLVWRFNRGDPAALCRIYQRYRSPLLRVAGALLNDNSVIEDVLHDVFVDFAQTTGRFRLKGSLRGYLSICVANRACDRNRTMQQRGLMSFNETLPRPAGVDGPEHAAMSREPAAKLDAALAQLPYEQRETIVLHLQGKLPFREIAGLKQISVNTAMSRYRYGLLKLRSALDGEPGP